MAASTDNDYNAASREISCKIEMYLDGITASPLTVTKSNYLLDCDILDEGCADNQGPFGTVTSNEISFTLHNENGMFSPTNASSIYYGKMVKGVPCYVFLKVGACDWDKIGEFYISDWQATITGITTTVTANDSLYEALNSPALAIPVVVNPTYAAFFTQIFTALGIPSTVDSTLTSLLSISYAADSNSELLTKLATAAMALCYCDHTGRARIRSMIASQSTRATLTDANQIMSVEASFSLTAGYDSACVKYYTTQESAAETLLSVDALSIPEGTSTTVAMDFTKHPMVRLIYASIHSSISAYITGLAANSNSVAVSLTADEATTGKLIVYGTVVDALSASVGATSGSNILTVDNVYIQSAAVANRVLTVLRRYVDSTLPTLTLQIRGNPLLNIGDKVVVTSTKYNLNYTGIIIRQHFTYSGALSSELTLLNASLLEVS